MTASSNGFPIDEDPLKEWILKAYHEKRKPGPPGDQDATANNLVLIEAVRDLLSGPPGGPSAPGRYYFESDAESAIWLFLKSLDGTVGGLGEAVYDPLLTGKKEGEMPPNLSLFVASLAGPIALKNNVDETVVCALVSAALLTLAKLGRARVQKSLGIG